MALDFASMLLQPTKTSAWDLSPGGGSGARENLKLARERFEWEKKRADEERKLAELEAKGLEAERRAKDEAAAQAELLKQRQAAALKYSEALASGQPDQVEALVPYLEALGSGVDITRGAGLPTYRFHLDAAGDRAKLAEHEAKQAAVDARPWAPSPEATGPGIMGRNHMVAPPPDLPVPQLGTVSDLQAQADERLSRLSPALKDIVTAHPVEYQGTADRARTGIEALNLPVDKAMVEYRMQLQGPIELAKAQLEAGQKKDEKNEMTVLEHEGLKQKGFERGKAVGGTYNFKSLIERRKALGQAKNVLTNKAGSDDYLAGATISRMMGESGQSTEGDIERALGDAASGFLTRVQNRLYKEAFDGLSSKQKEALLGVLDKAEQEDRKRVFDFLGNMDSAVAAEGLHGDVALGMRNYADLVVPKDWRDAYEADKAKRKKSAPADRGGKSAELDDPEEFEDDLMLSASEAGLDPEAIRPLIRKESGGDAQAVNKDSGATGILQFLNDDIAKSVGTTLEALKGMTAREQLPYVIEYFKTRGIDENSEPDDYAVAVAAPYFVGKPDTDVVYEKGSAEWKQNRGWRPPDGGDITVGSIKAFYRGSRKAGDESEATKRARALLGRK